MKQFYFLAKFFALLQGRMELHKMDLVLYDLMISKQDWESY
jgi:hypothetical protein